MAAEITTLTYLRSLNCLAIILFALYEKYL